MRADLGLRTSDVSLTTTVPLHVTDQRPTTVDQRPYL
jgi:hypothetical protein